MLSDAVDKRDTDPPVASPDTSQAEVHLLIRRSLDRDQRAFTELVRRHEGNVRSLAARVIRNNDDAEDIAQLVFLKLWGNLQRYDFRQSFTTWLYRITVNAAIDFMRKAKRHRHEQLENVINIESSDSKEPDQVLTRVRLHHQLERAGEKLKQRQKEAVTLRDVQGSTVGQVASALGIPEATARWHLHQARLTMRKELRKRCPNLLHSFGIR